MDDNSSELAGARQQGPPAAPTRPSVLLVDDSATSRAAFERMLDLIGCDVTTAVDGGGAVAAAAARTFDAILMDCQMPIVDGYEAARQIRADEGPDRHVPIIAITASAMPTVQRAVADAGMDGYLLKPPSLEELRAAVLPSATPP